MLDDESFENFGISLLEKITALNLHITALNEENTSLKGALNTTIQTHEEEARLSRAQISDLDVERKNSAKMIENLQQENQVALAELSHLNEDVNLLIKARIYADARA